MSIDLDDLTAIRETDSAGALGETDRYADQFQEGRTLIARFDGDIGNRPSILGFLGAAGEGAQERSGLTQGQAALGPHELDK
jgi:hypothetical protein